MFCFCLFFFSFFELYQFLKMTLQNYSVVVVNIHKPDNLLCDFFLDVI